ncbi:MULTISPECIES: dTDP-4-dehydrorhamnose 3,5-epimerase family protein [unclassified Marichromatium]|uniref:dTDP-4-dehydrorhamnose 3,5-epimerase family protein n=1 Tax=unclassified Marichromatium TaxID=2618417 RepID=UPI000F3BD483|nr:dTDP-4-dehydrorhamnose 3,5-epimerase family protein [Marichromatium sp. AB32]RNE93221.1 dTDP-4-keto-6-deoxy-D-glucose epimerase [Marichromatium sp. AB32]
MSARLVRHPTAIAGVEVIARTPLADARGVFERLYCAMDLAALGGGRPIVQINRSLTRARGTVRGLHYQRPPHAETKFVTCLRGAVWDLALDLRAGSPTFLQWHAERLEAERPTTLVIPEGCAHGFQTLTEDCELLYLHTAPHVPEAEGGVRVDDPRLAIPWPLPLGERSARDRALALLDDEFRGIAP